MIRKEEWKIYNNVFDSFTEKLIFNLSKKHFKHLVSQISIGKEANVFSVETNDGEYKALKIWRLDNANFNKMYNYLIQDPRCATLRKKKREIIFEWCRREHRNLLRAREVIRVPVPILVKDHVVLMEFIGDKEGNAAPLLKDQIPKDPKKFYDQIVEDITKLYKSGLVHGDLSQYNILNFNEKPVYIDFSQGTLTSALNSSELLKRDLIIINTFFKKHCKTLSDEEIFHKVTNNIFKR